MHRRQAVNRVQEDLAARDQSGMAGQPGRLKGNAQVPMINPAMTSPAMTNPNAKVAQRLRRAAPTNPNRSESQPAQGVGRGGRAVARVGCAGATTADYICPDVRLASCQRLDLKSCLCDSAHGPVAYLAARGSEPEVLDLKV